MEGRSCAGPGEALAIVSLIALIAAVTAFALHGGFPALAALWATDHVTTLAQLTSR